MTVRADNRLGDAPMVPVACQRCAATVLARKSSWQQTTVQWSKEAMASCSSWDAGSSVRGEFPVCHPLRDSIARAVVDGDLPVLGDGR